MQKVKDKCGTNSLSIIYFYSNEDIENTEGMKRCTDCQKEGFVLTRLREEYPDLRVYSFDYNLDLSAIKTLINIYNIKGELPALLIEDKIYYGFKSIEDIKNIIPALKKIDKEKVELQKATTTKVQ